MALARNLIGERLRQAPHVVQRETLPDDRPPAPGAKHHLVLFLLAPWPEEALLQDELGPFQILRRIDALDLIRVANLVALDLQPRADELVDAIRQLKPAVMRRRQGAQRGKDRRGRNNIRPHIEFAYLAHRGRRLPLLDDIDDAPPGIADNAAIGQRLDRKSPRLNS